VLCATRFGLVVPGGAAGVSPTREIPLEQVIGRLLAATPASVANRIGPALAQSVARWCRAMDVFAVRRVPLIRDLVAAGRLRTPYETTAQAANCIGQTLRGALDRVYWVADLYGTLTAPQLVDSIGTYMVKGTARPARRFLLVGIAFLAVWYLASSLQIEALAGLTNALRRLFGTPLIVLGTLCLVPLLLGLWFRQIANEATEFFSQVAEAQFIAATKELKRRVANRHHAILHRRVIAPELEAAAASPGPQDQDATTPAVVELLWNDYLDGAPFHVSDTRTTTQLLGNLVLVSLRHTRLKYSRRRQKRLRQLNLAGERFSLRGPCLWFQFISRSLAQQTAKLVVDYNSYALTLARAVTADDEQVQRHVDWLVRRLGKSVDQIDLLPAFRVRLSTMANPPRQAETAETTRRRVFHGNDFTALHFLSADPQIEADIRRRYGHEVAELMRRDRRDNIRRVFRTYPFHRWPREQRTVNLLQLYERHLQGGRVLLLPPKMLWWSVLLTARGLWLLGTFVHDVLHPTVGDLDSLREADPYAVAVRKIHRMRKPVFLECLRMRADFDPEYLGVLLPGSPTNVRGATTSPIEEDLALVRAGPGVQTKFRQLAAKRRRQILGFRRWLLRFGRGQHSSQSLRAMAVAYTIDYQDVRSRLEATDRLRRAFDQALADPGRTSAALGESSSLRARCWCWMRYRGKIKRLFRQPAFKDHDAREHRICRRLICRQRGPLLDALRALASRGAPEDPVEHAKQALLAVARDPDTWSRQLVVLRTVQTLSVLDLRTCCDLVAELGEYDTSTANAVDSTARE